MYNDIKLFAGSGCPELAQKISDYMNIPLSGWDIIQFPNQNIFVRLHGSVRGQDVFLIQSHTIPLHTNITTASDDLRGHLILALIVHLS